MPHADTLRRLAGLGSNQVYRRGSAVLMCSIGLLFHIVRFRVYINESEVATNARTEHKQNQRRCFILLQIRYHEDELLNVFEPLELLLVQVSDLISTSRQRALPLRDSAAVLTKPLVHVRS